MDMQGADLPRRQGAEGGLELGLLAVVKDSHDKLVLSIINHFSGKGKRGRKIFWESA